MANNDSDCCAHSIRTLARRGPFRIDTCGCGHIHMHIGYTSITLDKRSAETVQELLAVAMHIQHQENHMLANLVTRNEDLN